MYKYTNKKQCTNPNCKSEDVYWTKVDVQSQVYDFSPSGEYHKPNCPLYKCNKCGESFAIIKD